MGEIMDEFRDSLRILLHRVEGPINLGSVCRVLANFGLENLSFSGDLTGREEEVRKFALNAYPLLGPESKVPDFDGLLQSCHLVIGFTPRNPWNDGKSIPYEQFRDRVQSFFQQGLKVGLLFGNEAHGLSNEELTCCHYRVALPTHSGFPSMNLSHAVLAGILPLHDLISVRPEEHMEPDIANTQQALLLSRKVSLFMDAIDYLGPQPGQSTRQEIEKIWRTTPWTIREWELLTGLFHKAAVRCKLMKVKEDHRT